MVQSFQIGDNSMLPEQQVGSNVVNDVANFVENIRIDQHPSDTRGNDSSSQRGKLDLNTAELQNVQRRAERNILEAEKFHAGVEQPGRLSQIQERLERQAYLSQGNLTERTCSNEVVDLAATQRLAQQDHSHPKEDFNIMNIGSGVSDDDFFHLTCHIEPSLIHKIEQGEFVELEKLLPKDKLGNGKNNEESRLEWVQRDAGTFLVPAQKDNKISNFRRWEQAFRAYATIYCGAHPQRSKEIWQYITVINTAASSYQWDNVYNYDITFKHLMAFNPQRSWAVTYNQMWNLSIKDPIPKNNRGSYGNGTFYHGKSNNYGSGNTSSNPMQVRRNRSDYCWNFNKGVPCKFGAKCKFIERCKYCDSPTHGVQACHKLQKKENGNINNNHNHNNKAGQHSSNPSAGATAK